MDTLLAGQPFLHDGTDALLAGQPFLHDGMDALLAGQPFLHEGMDALLALDYSIVPSYLTAQRMPRFMISKASGTSKSLATWQSEE